MTIWFLIIIKLKEGDFILYLLLYNAPSSNISLTSGFGGSYASLKRKKRLFLINFIF